MLCAANTICLNERNSSCPVHSESAAGSDSIDDCRCIAGFFRNNTNGIVACTLCPIDHYCLNEAIFGCPIKSTSEEGAVAAVDCKCLPGHTGNNGGACTACPAGTFKVDSGAGGCTPCTANTYSSATARTVVCDDCAEGHVSGAGSVEAEACQSAPGWYTGAAWHYADARAGVWQCPHGTYQPGVAQTACLRCGNGEVVQPVDWVKTHWTTHYSHAGSVDVNNCSACDVNSVTAVVVAYADYDEQFAHQCVCEPGFSRADATDDTCTVCAAGTHKETYDDTGCVSCPAHQYPDPASTPKGDYSECTVDECYTLGAWACAQCPSDSSAPAGSQSKRDCVCNPGYQGHPWTVQPCVECSAGMYSILDPPSLNQGRACVKCQADTYSKTTLAATSCVSCTEHASASEGSDAIDDCTCGAGYQMFNNVCQSCEPGQYSTNNSTCQACESNTFSSQYRSFACTDCPAHSSYAHIAASSVWNCSCNAGYTGSDGDSHCDACPAGTYKTTSGFEVCTPCEQDTFSAMAATQCVSCGTHSSTAGSTGQDHCVCDAGYELRNGMCQQCRSGYVKATGGNVACVACLPGTASDSNHTTCVECAANTYQPKAAGECLPCRGNSTSYSGSTLESNCRCVVGYNPTSMADLTCIPCTKGTYKASVSNNFCNACSEGSSTAFGAGSAASDCVECGISHYSISVEAIPVNGLRCEPCPSDKYAVAGSHGPGACKCNVGYHGADGLASCQQCQAGTYKNSVGSAACTECADGTILTATGGIYATQCELCPVATYSSYAITSATACLECPANEISTPGSTGAGDCYCNAGFQDAAYPASGCVSCSAGTFKSTETPGPLDWPDLSTEEFNQLSFCRACPPDTYSNVTGSTRCLNCTANARHNTQRTACVCKAGHECSSTTSGAAPPQGCTCEPCQPGTFGDGSGCTRCPSTHYYPEQDTPYVSDLCRKCPANSSHPNVTAVVGAYGVAQCTCHAGFNRVNNTCVECSDGFYCPTEVTQYKCPSNSSSPSAATAKGDCQCLPGMYGDPGQDLRCRPCPVNTYCLGGSATVQCPANSTTRGLLGSATRTACECVAGFYEDTFSRLCFACPAQTYCAAQVKYQCPPGSSSSRGSTECRCNPGYRTNRSSVSLKCEKCPADAVCRGGDDWDQCSPGALNVHDNCECSAGASCSVNASVSCVPPARCDDCAENVYCTGNAMFACPEYTTAPAGSSLVVACRCLEGYYRDGDTCHPCPRGSYCVNQTQYRCADHDEHLTGYAEMAVSRDVCVCKSSYFRARIDDVCRICPQDYYCRPEQQGAQLPNVFACMQYAYTDAPGSTTPDACRCHAGLKFSAASGITQCTPCELGERCAAGHVEPEQCGPLNREPNKEHTACVCRPGFASTFHSVCDACAAGKVKPAAGDTACVDCPANTWALNTTFCAPCPASAHAAAGSRNCTCDLGTVADGGVGTLLRCEPCGVGTFFGDGRCQGCPELSNSTVGAVGVNECLCQRGYVLGTGADFCVACPADTYEDGGVCTPCGAGAVSNNASTSAEACVCRSSLCQHMWRGDCRGGCEDAPESCLRCQPGTFKNERSTRGNNEVCQTCPVNTYQPDAGQTGCTSCPSTRVHGLQGQHDINACVCQAGFAPPGFADIEPSVALDYWDSGLGASVCHPCAPGSHKTLEGNTMCQACPRNTFASANGTVACTICQAGVPHPPSGSYFTVDDGSTSVTDCKCDTGHQLQNNSCVSCARGSFKPVVGHDACQLCGSTDYVHTYGADEIGAALDQHCVACPDNSGRDAADGVLMDDISQCLCMPGHDTWTDSACSACPEYMYKIGYSNTDCVGCPDDYFFVSRITHCQPCSLAVQPCGIDSFWSIQGVCDKQQTVSLAFHGALRWGRSESDCGCAEGHERVYNECTECGKGKYRANDQLGEADCQKCPLSSYQERTGSPSCVSCPGNSSHLDGLQRLGSATCICEAGYFWQAASSTGPGQPTGSCVACAAGKFKPVRSWADLDESDITHANEAECTSCPVNTFSLAAASTCTACGANMFSDSGADSFDKCYCNAGFGLIEHDVAEAEVRTLAGNKNVDKDAALKDGVGGLAVLKPRSLDVWWPDGAKLLFIDYWDSRVRQFDVSSREVSMLCPSPTGTTAHLIKVHPDGTAAYIVGTENNAQYRIYRLDLTGSSYQVAPWVGSSVAATDQNDDEGTNAGFQIIQGIDFSPDGGTLVVLERHHGDLDVQNTAAKIKIRKVAIATGEVTTVGLVQGGLFDPRGLAVAPGGASVFVAEYFGHRIVSVDISTNKEPAHPICKMASKPCEYTSTCYDAGCDIAATTVAGSGGEGHVDGIGTNAMFFKPLSLDLSPDDSTLSIAEDFQGEIGGRIRALSIADWTVSTLAGQAGRSGEQDGIASAATLKPKLCVYAPSGTQVYLADERLIRILDLQSTVMPRDACVACPNGTYWGGESEPRQACTTCPVNKDSPAGSNVIGDCTCRPGHGKALSADIETPCQACVSGKFAPGGANVPCVSCGWGTVTEPAAEAHSPEHCMCNAALGVRDSSTAANV